MCSPPLFIKAIQLFFFLISSVDVESFSSLRNRRLHCLRNFPLPQLTPLFSSSNPTISSKAGEIETFSDDDNENNNDEVDLFVQRGLHVPIVNSAELKITSSNPFGLQVVNIEAARKELLNIITSTSERWEADKFKHYRIEYLIKYLESKYMPIHTTQFLSLAMNGDWDHAYTNVLTPYANKALSYRIVQRINPNEDTTNGEIENKIFWKFDPSISLMENEEGENLLSFDDDDDDDDDNSNVGDDGIEKGGGAKTEVEEASYGELIVKSSYSITPKGSLAIELQEHILMPEKMPKDPQQLLMSMQRSVPFEFFDPNESVFSNTYIDPGLRIIRIAGPKFVNVVNVFLKASSFSVNIDDISKDTERSNNRRGSV